MRTTLAIMLCLPLLIFGQGQDKTFYVTQPASAADLTAMATAVRTVIGLQRISTDYEHAALVMQGPVDQLAAADWLLQQLDAPLASKADYKTMSDAIAVMPMSASATVAEITALTTVIRTVSDLQRLFPLERQKALVGRGSPEKIASAEWMIQQLLPREGKPPAGDSAAYPSPIVATRSDGENPIVRIFRMDPGTTNAQLTSTVTAIRTVADLQRLFPFQTDEAIVASGPPERVAVAEWMVHELTLKSTANATHQTAIPGLMDGIVRLFFVPEQTDLTAMVMQIRASTGIRRTFPFNQPRAVVVRGRPDQVSTAEALVAKFTGAER